MGHSHLGPPTKKATIWVPDLLSSHTNSPKPATRMPAYDVAMHHRQLDVVWARNGGDDCPRCGGRWRGRQVVHLSRPHAWLHHGVLAVPFRIELGGSRVQLRIQARATVGMVSRRRCGGLRHLRGTAMASGLDAELLGYGLGSAEQA